MSDNASPVVAPGAVTAHHDFFPASHQGENLFSIREGVPLSDAFDQLTLLLTAAQGAVEVLDITSSEDAATGPHWAAVHVLKFANALVQAMHTGQMRHCKSTSD